jgi:hypothetical protein
MKQLVLAIILLSSCCSALADTTHVKTVVNIFFRDRVDGTRDMLQFPQAALFQFPAHRNTWRNFIQVQPMDTGVLYVSLMRKNIFRPSKKFSPDHDVINKIPIRHTGEIWLILSDKRHELTDFWAGKYSFLTTEEFAKQYPIAYRKFKRRGFQKIFENVPVNTPLR